MKSLTKLIVIAFLLLTSAARAQTTSLPGNTFSIGITGGEYGYDSGLGLEVSTSTFRNTAVFLRVRGTVSWLELYKSTYDQWVRYETLNVSMVYNIFAFERSRGYVEMGTYMIFPNAKFSEHRSFQGLTSSMGVELFVITNPKFNMCYYFSSGFGYVRAYADKLENRPRYGNGFVFNNGLRFYF